MVCYNYFDINQTRKRKMYRQNVQFSDLFSKCECVVLLVLLLLLNCTQRTNNSTAMFMFIQGKEQMKKFEQKSARDTHARIHLYYFKKISSELTNENKTWGSRYVIKSFPTVRFHFSCSFGRIAVGFFAVCFFFSLTFNLNMKKLTHGWQQLWDYIPHSIRKLNGTLENCRLMWFFFFVFCRGKVVQRWKKCEKHSEIVWARETERMTE